MKETVLSRLLSLAAPYDIIAVDQPINISSLRIVELIIDIEGHYDIDLSEYDIIQSEVTLEEIATMVEKVINSTKNGIC